MRRRGFLSAIAAIAAGAVLDPDRLLWVPGRKVISIPRERYAWVDLGYMPLFTTLLVDGPDPVKLDCFRMIRRPPYYERIGQTVEPGEQFEVDTIGPCSAKVTIDTKFQVVRYSSFRCLVIPTHTSSHS